MPARRKTKAEILVHTAALVLGVCALIAITAGAGLGAWRMYERLRLATDESDAADRQLALLSAQQIKSEQALQALTTDRGVEAALRERYGVVKPGEEVIQIVEDESTGASSDTAQEGNILERVFRTLFVW